MIQEAVHLLVRPFITQSVKDNATLPFSFSSIVSHCETFLKKNEESRRERNISQSHASGTVMAQTHHDSKAPERHFTNEKGDW